MGKYDQNFMAFTIKFNRRTNVLFTKIKVSLPFDPKRDGSQVPTPIECNAIWDTGASISTVTKKLARQLGLLPTGKVDVSNTSGSQTRDTYLVNIHLPNNVVLTYVRVVECESLLGNFEFLIGMDIISNGDFAVTNVNGQTVMSYRLPSIEEINYVEEAELIKQNRKIYGKIEEQKEKREANQLKKKIKEKRKKEKQKKKIRNKNRKKGK